MDNLGEEIVPKKPAEPYGAGRRRQFLKVPLQLFIPYPVSLNIDAEPIKLRD